MSPKDITKSPALCICHAPFSTSRKDCFSSKHLHLRYHLPFLLLPSFHTVPPSPLLPHHQLNLLFQMTAVYISFPSFPASWLHVLSISPNTNNTSIILSHFFTYVSSLSTQTTYIPCSNPSQMPPIRLPSYCKLCLRAPE